MSDAGTTGAAGSARSGEIEANGVRLAYEEVGSGPPVVFVHAGVCDRRMWAAQAADLGADHRVIRYDARGFGGSGSVPGEYGPHEDLRALLAGLGVGRARVVGASMGGGVALDLALEHPELVEALVLVGSVPHGHPPSAEVEAGWAAVEELVEAGDVAGAVELELRMWVDGPRRGPGEVDPAVRERVRAMNAAIFARDLGEGIELRARKADPPAVGRLGEMRVPTLVVWGDGDQPCRVAGSELMAAAIPGARRATMAGTAHLPSMERPGEFNGLLRGLFGSV